MSDAEEEDFVRKLKRLDIYHEILGICQVCGVWDVGSLRGTGKQLHVAKARHLAMAFVREHFAWSYPTIGELFGRDHTTVMHSCRRAAQLVQKKVKK